MSDVLLFAATRLADLLAQENAALATLDLPRAAALLADKQAAAERFAAVRSATTAAGPVPVGFAPRGPAPSGPAPISPMPVSPTPIGPVLTGFPPARPMPTGPVAAAIARLRDLAEQNRRLLERGIAIQGDVIGLLAGALRKSGGPSRYAATGAPTRSVQPVAFALSARA